MRLATKITLPFVALFALLLLVLGVVLAREILQEVESRVESEQRFILEVATFPGFALDEEALRQIRDRAVGRASLPAEPPAGAAGTTAIQAGTEARPTARSEFVVLQSGAPVVTTFTRSDRAGWATVEALQKAAKTAPLDISAPEITRHISNLAGQRWLILHTTRASRGPAAATRHFYLLYPYAEIETAQNRALHRIIWTGAIGLALAAVLGLLIGHWISSPVRRLAATAKRISAGGLNEGGTDTTTRLSPRQGANTSVPPSDEIADLAEAFRSMLDSLRHSQDELLKAERLAVTGKLAASVAHEIRNPLTSLRMTIEMLKSRAGSGVAPGSLPAGTEAGATAADKSTQEAYAIVLSEIDRLALAVEELLTFARPRPPQRQPTDLNKLVTDTLAFLDRQLAHAHVKSLAELDAKLPSMLSIDPAKIRQLLVNLILNAQQAIVRDGCITIRTHWDGEKKSALLSVSDTGPGIAEEVRARVFELFVSTKPGGGGLGLAIAKQIAEEHGGTIAFETSAKGTTFTVTLPNAE
ncbi:MAG TPA: ATP-binding protein [Planctomycetota bacterium]|jgi:signal transduction histidine kinase